mmetsp:Transcript_16918/g.49692  ORF Transcript_16918/g.49692 Transcript_16918/m.49692 type:complete len:201 (-) Transcript_16918:7-609(-)
MPSTRATRGSRRTSTRPRSRTRSPSRWARSSPSSTLTTPPTSHGLRGCCRARRPRPRAPSESTPPPTRRPCLQRSSPSTRTVSTSACGPRARAAPSRRSGSGCARARRRAKRRSPSSRSCSRRRMRGSRAGSDEAAAAGAFCAWLACRKFREVASEAAFSSRDRERDVAEEVTLAAYGGKQVFVGWIRAGKVRSRPSFWV